MKIKIIGVIIGIFLLTGIAYATYYVNTGTDNHTYYRVNNGITKSIDRGTKCRKIVNSSGKHIFIPIKTNAEWYSFVNHKPSGTTITNECYIPRTSNLGSSYWMRGPGSRFVVCYHGKCVDGNTAGESASIYRYWKTNWSAYTYAVSGWKVKRGSFHHSSGGANYYYVTIAE